ncbi:unnamed protein product, partial [Medioppia subpectinata]
CVTICDASNQWPNHDISTLKLLQIVHRHGDRTAKDFAPNDPFDSEVFWPEGDGKLTTAGKYRMYKMGEFLRQEYGPYFGDQYSPREVYARSAAADRCLESVANLLAGAYPPKQTQWQWNKGSDASLGRLWQPIPINTVLDKKEDRLLDDKYDCPAVDKELEKIYNTNVIRKFLEENKQLYKKLSEIVGQEIKDISTATQLYEILKIELEHNYYWNTSEWSVEEEKQMVDQLSHSQLMQMRYEWDSPIIRRLKSGALIQELNTNFNKVLKNKKKNLKLYVYSTHHSEVGGLMHAYNVYNNLDLPYGTAVLLELHQNPSKDY